PPMTRDTNIPRILFDFFITNPLFIVFANLNFETSPFKLIDLLTRY
ncbi:MAG: hypothetical protein ACI9FE_000359, partial [Porticoccaceae bacterium]